MAVLRSIGTQGETVRFILPRKQVTIGRRSVAGDTVLCDIELNDLTVSRPHARVSFQDDRYWIEDLQSKNHTRLNSRIIEKRELLCDGDEIQFGGRKFVFYQTNSLADETGSVPPWENHVPEVDGDSGDEDSVCRVPICADEEIPADDPRWSEVLRDSGIRHIINVRDYSASELCGNFASEKLRALFALLHRTSGVTSDTEVLARATSVLFDSLPGTERIATVVRRQSVLRIACCSSRMTAFRVELCMPLVRRVMGERQVVLYEDHWTPRVDETNQATVGGIRNILVAPLLGENGDATGAIQLDSSAMTGGFKSQDAELLAVLCCGISFLLRTVAGEVC